MRSRLRRDDERAQAGGFVVLILILAVSALLWGLLDAAATPIFADLLAGTNDADATAAIEQRERIWENILFAVLGLATLFILARSVRQSRT
jgi:hypothetical protein